MGAAGDLGQHPYSSFNFEHKAFSQFGEDGVLLDMLQNAQMFNKTPHSFLEIGSGDGRENCTRILVSCLDWTGVWIDADAKNVVDGYRPNTVRTYCAMVSLDNIAWVSSLVPQRIGVLSIDIDGNDYWIWKALCEYPYGLTPDICIIETQIQHKEEEPFIMPYNSRHVWDHKSIDVGANLPAMKMLGHQLGYTYIGTPTNSVNAFFVRTSLMR